MNFAQFGLFFIFVAAVLCAGMGIYKFMARDNEAYLNQGVFWGEVCLLGSTLIVGEMLILSLLHLYTANFLWAAVLLNFLFFLGKRTRQGFGECVQKISLSVPAGLFVILMAIFFFRNCYFLVDVDSHSTYLFTQKLWLYHETSIFAQKALNAIVFVPHFDAVPYALGISLFGQETLFPELINWFWRFIVALLVFGYTSYRLNGYCGLAAVMLVVFNDHIFYSGENQSVLINGALIAFLFAAAHNIWESRVKNSSFRFLLAIVFLLQLMGNKYQMAYVVFLLTPILFLLQVDLRGKFNDIVQRKNYLVILLIGLIIPSLWYVKNFLATGLATFPVFAGKFHVLGWTPEMDYVFLHYFRGLTPSEFLKYSSYLFIWPGISASKYVGLAILFLPFIFMSSCLRMNFKKEEFLELSFWLGVSFLAVMGICLASHQDPRYYRFVIGIYTFTAVLAIHYILQSCLGIKKEAIISGLILLLALPGAKIIFEGDGTFIRPSVRDNIHVILNKIHMDYAIKRHFENNLIIEKDYAKNPDKVSKGAWDNDVRNGLSAFLLPVRPQVGLWSTTVVNWNSYDDEDKIIKDLQGAGIEWIMTVDEKSHSMIFYSLKEYAQRLMAKDRSPKTIAFPYDLPPELSRTKL